MSYTVCRGDDVASVHRSMSALFFPRPSGYPDVRMMRKPIWSTWAWYKENVNQSSVEEMVERILHYNFSHRYRHHFRRLYLSPFYVFNVLFCKLLIRTIYFTYIVNTVLHVSSGPSGDNCMGVSHLPGVSASLFLFSLCKV